MSYQIKQKSNKNIIYCTVYFIIKHGPVLHIYRAWRWLLTNLSNSYHFKIKYLKDLFPFIFIFFSTPG